MVVRTMGMSVQEVRSTGSHKAEWQSTSTTERGRGQIKLNGTAVNPEEEGDEKAAARQAQLRCNNGRRTEGSQCAGSTRFRGSADAQLPIQVFEGMELRKKLPRVIRAWFLFKRLRLPKCDVPAATLTITEVLRQGETSRFVPAEGTRATVGEGKAHTDRMERALWTVLFSARHCQA